MNAKIRIGCDLANGSLSDGFDKFLPIFPLEHIFVPNYSPHSFVPENNSYTGAFGKLQNDEFDTACKSYLMTSERYDSFSFTQPLYFFEKSKFSKLFSNDLKLFKIYYSMPRRSARFTIVNMMNQRDLISYKIAFLDCWGTFQLVRKLYCEKL